MAWTEERKKEAIKMYTEQEPTPATSVEALQEVADSMGESVNGVRMILTKAGVYIKKEIATKSATTTSSGSTRVSKESAFADLVKAIESKGLEADMEIISKLTGKAAIYFTKLFA